MGGSRGIGRAIALGLAGEGAHVAICARTETSLRETEAALAALGGRVYAAACDAVDARALERFLDYVTGHDHVWICRRIDIANHWREQHPYAG